MIAGQVAKRYSQALFEVAKEQNLLDQVEQDLNLFVETFKMTEGFQTFLTHPQIGGEVKKEMVSNIFADSISWVTKNFLLILVDSGRENTVEEILKEYSKLANDAREIAAVTAISAKPLTDAEKQQLEKLYKERLNKVVKLENIIDPAILGGLIVRVGDRVYDGSLIKKLKTVKKSLVASRV